MTEIKRPPCPRLGERLIAALLQAEEWAKNEIPLSVTLYDQGGERTEPAMMTRHEVEMWRAARLPKESS